MRPRQVPRSVTKKADIFIGEINSTDGDVSSLGTCLYDAASVFGKTSDGGSLSVSTDTP